MKKTLILLLALFSIVTYGQTPTYPVKTNQFINDFANVIPDDKEESLSKICKDIQNESSSQIVVITTNDVDKEYPIEDYSITLAKKWGIGQKGVDNGLMILICPNNHKARIEVGYGLESVLTDALTSRMQSEYFKPNFKNGDFYTGIQQMLTSIKSTISPEAIQQQKLYADEQQKKSKELWSNFWDIVLIIIAIGLICFLIILRIKKEAKKQAEIKEAEEAKKRKDELLIAKAADLEKKFHNSLDNIIKQLKSFGDFLDAQNIVLMLKDLGNITNSNIEKAHYADYEQIINPSFDRMKELTSDIIEKYKIQQEVKSFNRNVLNYKEKLSNLKDILDKSQHLNKSYQPVYQGIDFNNYNIFYSQSFGIVESIYNQSLNKLNELKFKEAYRLLNDAQNEINKSQIIKESLDNINNSIVNCISYINSFQENLKKTIQDVDRVFSNSDVTEKSRKIWNQQKLEINFSVNSEYNNPFAEQKRIESFLNTLNEYKRPALKDISNAEEQRQREEEERRRRQREEEDDRIRRQREEEYDRRRRQREEEDDRRRRQCEEEDDRRRRQREEENDRTANSSSSSNDTSLGGGDFGGGGSTSDW